MSEKVELRPTRRERVLDGISGIAAFGPMYLLVGISGIALAGAMSPAATQGQTDNQPQYVNLPDWNCKQSNQLGIKDRGSLDFTRPQTSVTEEILSITYPAKRDDEDFYETILYENQGLQSGQILRYYSEGNDECPLPYEGAPIIK